MRPDLVLLRELVETGSSVTTPRRGAPEAGIAAAEAVVGPLPPSYRWWLAEFGCGRVDGMPVASLPPVDPPEGYEGPSDAVTEGLDGARLWFCEQPCGPRYGFALDVVVDGEHPVVEHDPATGEDEPVADSFAGFLAVTEARATGLRDGPNPTIARLWRSTPGVLREDGVLLYGPHVFRERNETFEVRRYAPDWVLVGDDSGGSGFFMRHHGRDRTSVYRLDLGAVERDVAAVGEFVTDDLLGLLAGAGDFRR